MAKKFALSFKETERDQKLYDVCISKGDKSNYVKDCIEFFINHHAKTVTAVQEYQQPQPKEEPKPQEQPTIEIVAVDEGILDIMGG